MKYQSKIKDVQFEKWISPVMNEQSLWLESIIQTVDSINFIFSTPDSKGKEFQVLRMDRVYSTPSSNLEKIH